MTEASDKPNAQQIEFWNGDAGVQWRERNKQMEVMLQPIGLEAIKRAKPHKGEKIIDIGCGCGGTTFDLAEAISGEGQVVGVDISEPMLVLANEKLAEHTDPIRSNTSFLLADASQHEFSADSFDLIFSRFGIMFFDKPTEAFRNIRKGLSANGRLTALCWGPVAKNDWVLTPMLAIKPLLPPSPPMDPRAPGPFAFSDKDYTTGILQDAGFTDISFDLIQPSIKTGDGTTLDAAIKSIMEMGPLARSMAEADDALKQKIKDALVEVVADNFEDGYVSLKGACWIVSASNGPS